MNGSGHHKNNSAKKGRPTTGNKGLRPSLPDPLRIDLDFFEGPLDLLLYLIRKNEYDIFDIPIAQITKQYLAYLDLLKDLDLEIAGEFLVMAATLMKIKSRMLLPRPKLEEEEDGEDPRAALVRQLLEYQKYKEAAEQFQDQEILGRDVFARKFPSPELSDVESEESSYLEIDVYELIEALRQVLKRIPERSPHVIRMEPYSVRERMGQLVEMLKGVKSITFEELFEGASTRIEVITTFLSLLEMVKLQLVKIYQTGHKEPIRLTPLVTEVTDETQDGTNADGVKEES